LISLLALSVFPAVSAAQTPPGYAANYSETITAVRKEGKLVIYAATDLAAASPLIRDFQLCIRASKLNTMT
jgi:iron(III) transport system substrate-binding protein